MDLGERIKNLLHNGYSVTFSPYLKELYGDKNFKIVLRKDGFNVSKRYDYDLSLSECPDFVLDIKLKATEEIFEAKEKHERDHNENSL